MTDIERLKKKEDILAKLADILCITFIWESNKGFADIHKREIKALLKEYYELICQSGQEDERKIFF